MQLNKELYLFLIAIAIVVLHYRLCKRKFMSRLILKNDVFQGSAASQTNGARTFGQMSNCRMAFGQTSNMMIIVN